MAGSRSNWELMTGSSEDKEAKVKEAQAKAAKAPVGKGMVKDAVNTILDAKERRRKALEEAGAM
jgi:hypothetical protein